jgi:septum formation protein
MRIILASQSSFRKRALEIVGVPYETKPHTIDEKSLRDDDPYVLARVLSEAKARDIGSRESNAIVVAGDLFVVFDGRIYEKPADEEEALGMLRSFSANTIDIIAGVAVYNSKTEQMRSSVETCTVTLRQLEDYEIEDYVSRYPVRTLSGAFEGDGLLRFADRIEGKYPFLTGFPLSELIRFLRENGLRV